MSIEEICQIAQIEPSDENKEIIEKYRKDKYRIAIFITGKENYPEILKKIIAKQVELTDDVC